MAKPISQMWTLCDKASYHSNRPDKVNDALLKSTGASGVVHKGQGVQIIYGPRVTVIKSDLEDYLASVTEEHFEDDAAENNTADTAEAKNENAASDKAQESDVKAEKEAGDVKEPTKHSYHLKSYDRNSSRPFNSAG